MDGEKKEVWNKSIEKDEQLILFLFHLAPFLLLIHSLRRNIFAAHSVIPPRLVYSLQLSPFSPVSSGLTLFVFSLSMGFYFCICWGGGFLFFYWCIAALVCPQVLFIFTIGAMAEEVMGLLICRAPVALVMASFISLYCYYLFHYILISCNDSVMDCIA